MFRLAAGWNPIDPQSSSLARNVYLDDRLVGRIVDTTAEIFINSSPHVHIFEADLLLDEIWETGDERFTDERSAVRSLEERLGATVRGASDLLPK